MKLLNCWYNLQKISQQMSLTILGLSILTLSTHASATSCGSVFPDVLSSYSNYGNATFSSSAIAYDSDGVLAIKTLSGNHSSSCDSQACTSSGVSSANLELPLFNHTTSSQDLQGYDNRNYYMNQGTYDVLSLGSNSSLDIRQNGGLMRLSHFTTGNNVSLTFASGTYWFDKWTMGSNATIEVGSGDKVTIFVNEVSFGSNSQFNVSGDTDQLVIISYDDFTFAQNATMNGYLYAEDRLNFGSDGEFYGAFNAEDISLGSNTEYYTRLSGIATADFGDSCSLSEVLPEPIAYYSMDMCAVSAGSNTIIDSINANNGDTEGNVTVDYQAKYCQGALLDGSQSYIDLPEPTSGSLSEGSISLFFNTSDIDHSNNPSAGSMGLLSRDANGTESGGHLTIWITDSGGISVRQQSASSSYRANTNSYIVQENRWHHLVYTWGGNGMRIYLDGVLRNSPTAYTGGFSTNGVPITIGANAWTYSSSNSASRKNQLKDFFIGAVDEVRIYDEQLNASQISNLEQLDPQSCTNCSSDPVLISHWSGDVCSFEQNVLPDVVSGINGVIRNGITNEYSSRFCQGLVFDGTQSYATVAHNNDLEIAQGAVSMWVKLSDLNHSNTSDAGGNGLFAKDSVNYANGGHFELRVDANGKVQVRHQTTSSSKTMGTSSQVIFENQWHHIVYSFGAAGSYIYVDGQAVHHESNYVNGLATNDDTIVLGASARRATRGSTAASNYRDFLLGEMDHVKIFMNQPTQLDINEWYTELAANCTTCNSLIAEYTFDDDSDTSTTITDTSGKDNHGTLASALDVVLLGDNVSCKAMEAEDNRSSTSVSFDTGVDANDIGSQGGITFWYQSKTSWTDGVARKLFDASEGNKYLFLTKTGSGKLSFGIEDANDYDFTSITSSYTFDSTDWVHIGVQWNLESKEFRIFVNGQEAIVSTYYNVNSTALGALGNIVFGDNRINYAVNDSTNNSAHGYIDEIRMYSQAVSQSQVLEDMQAASSCATVHHYQLEHPSSALTCETPELIIKACADESCSSVSTQQSTLSFTPDVYSPTNTITFVGQTSLSIENSSTGTFNIVSSSQDPAAPVQCSNNCEINYEDAGIQFFNVATGNTVFSNTFITAEQSLDMLGLRVVGNNGGTCEGLVDGQQSIDLSYQCISTTSAPYSPSQCNVPFAGIALSGGASQSGSISLDFDSNGETDFRSYNYADAGILKLTASAIVDGASIQAGSVELNMMPQSLQIASYMSEITAAGKPFTLKVTALGAAGSTLPGYQENQMQMAVERLLPTSESAIDAQFYFDVNNYVSTSLSQTFGSINSTFTNGQATSSSAYMEEVGTYQITVKDQNYLGTEISGNTITLGRFTPAYFDVQATHQASLENINNSFTYVGQIFGYETGLEPSFQVTAYNAIGRITQNYTGDLWTLSPSLASFTANTTLSNSSVYSGALNIESSPANLLVVGRDIYDGQATYTLTGETFSYTKVVSPTGNDASPFEGSIDVSYGASLFSDADNVCYQSNYPDSGCSGFDTTVTGNTQKYGRLRIENAFGPENVALSVNIYSEYLDAGQWRINTEDSSTQLALTQIGGGIGIIRDQTSVLDLTALLAPLSLNTTLQNGKMPDSTLSIGPIFQLGSPVSGSFYIELVPSATAGHWSNHLNYDWDGDGDIDLLDTPWAKITLGIYKGSEKTLHWREVMN